MTWRIPLPEPGEISPDVAQLVALTAPPGREPARTMAMLARQPDLFAPFLGWAAALALNGVLPHREVLAARYDAPALVEIPLVVGQYAMCR